MEIIFAASNRNIETSDEESSLLKKPTIKKYQHRYSSSRKCISSKAALLVLLWSFIVTLASSFIFYSNLALRDFLDYSLTVVHGCVAMVYFFYPLAGHLADTKYGRYKTVVKSLHVTFGGLVVALVGIVALVLSLVCQEYLANFFCILVAVSLIVLTLGVALLVISNVGFSANALQFGLDQLYDSPTEDQTVFIQWYLWTGNVGVLIATVVLFNISGKFQTLLLLKCILLGLVVLGFPLLLTSLCLAHRRKNWFLIEPRRSNPYILVYKVFKFSNQHKVPVHRSAFTYCEDDIPSGLDLGKNKYGGPFTTEQVEDVKAFYGILKVLFALGPIFFLLLSSEPSISVYPQQNQTAMLLHNISGIRTNRAQEILLQNAVLLSLVSCVCIPLYLLLFRPFLKNYTVGMLRRMGLGATAILFCEVAALVIHTVAYVKTIDLGLIYNIHISSTQLTTDGSRYLISLLVTRQVLAALARTIFEIALFEFICSQSPTSMKGLLIGLSYTIRGIFATVCNITVAVLYETLHNNSFFNFKITKQIISIAVGILAVLVYLHFARNYKYRERDEPCHVRRYVEEYYSQIVEEKLYDYST